MFTIQSTSKPVRGLETVPDVVRTNEGPKLLTESIVFIETPGTLDILPGFAVASDR